MRPPISRPLAELRARAPVHAGLAGFAALAALTLLLVAPGCGSPEDQGGQGGQGGRGRGGPGGRGSRGGPGGAEVAAIPVEVEPVRREDIAKVLPATARLAPVREVSVVARLSARLIELPVDFGDRVSEGQLLARLDDSEPRSQLAEARSESVRRRGELERAERSFNQGLLAKETYQQAVSARETADARTEQARLRLDWAAIRSPLAGVVLRRGAEVGQVLSSGQEIVAVADLTRLRAEIDLPERDLGLVRVGQEAEVTVDPWPDRIFRATVERIAPTVAPESGTFRVRIEMSPEAGEAKLRPGLFARVRLLVDLHRDARIISRRALLVDRERPAVFVVREGRAELAEVETGYVDGERVELLSGLAPDERVVVLGQDALAPGAPVRVVGEEAELSPGAAAPVPPAMARQGAGPRGGGELDPERVEMMLTRFQQNPEFKARWDAALAKDPELATDAGKRAAFVREAMQSFRGRRGGGSGS